MALQNSSRLDRHLQFCTKTRKALPGSRASFFYPRSLLFNGEDYWVQSSIECPLGARQGPRDQPALEERIECRGYSEVVGVYHWVKYLLRARSRGLEGVPAASKGCLSRLGIDAFALEYWVNQKS